MNPVAGPRFYGLAAEEYARHLGELPAYVVAGDLTRAWNEMLHARSRGADVAAMFVFDDPRARIAGLAAEAVCAQVAGYDERRFLIEKIATGDLDIEGQPILQRSVHPPDVVTALRDLARISGTVIVRSFAELRRLRHVCGPMHANVARWFPARTSRLGRPRRVAISSSSGRPIPPPARPRCPPSPSTKPTETSSSYAGGRRPPTPASRTSNPPRPDSQTCSRARVCIVDATSGDPGWAYAFAERGVPVAAASTSGADGFVDGLAIYDPWSFRSIAGAVAEALGRGPGAVRHAPPGLDAIARSLSLAAVSPPAREPLVSIVIPTYNRREILHRSLLDLVRQTYRNLEILVVNDGGESIADLNFDPRIRILELPANVGAVAAANAGIEASRGEYVLLNPDDDALYLDHIMRLVAALERTSADVAHSNTLIRQEVTGASGTAATVYNTDRFNSTLDRAESYAFHRAAGNSILVRRSVYEAIGKWDEHLFFRRRVSDSLGRGLRRRARSVHHGGMVGPRQGPAFGESGKHAFDAFEALCARHPAPGRSYIAALRASMFEKLA